MTMTLSTIYAVECWILKQMVGADNDYTHTKRYQKLMQKNP